MVRVSVGLTRVLLPVLGWAQVQEELRSMECWVLGYLIQISVLTEIDTQPHLFTQETASELHSARPMVQALRVL